MKAIVAAIDFSPLTKLVVEQAAALARTLEAKVLLLTVLIEPVYSASYAPRPPRVARLAVDHEKTIRRRLEQLQRSLQSNFVPAEVVVARGSAAQTILAEAEKHDAALIVIGSHNHNALFEFVLGSTTQEVVKRSRRPVFVIPAGMRRTRRPKLRVVASPVAASRENSS